MPEPEAAAFERRIVSVLFADLVGFTSLSEQLDPEDVATIQDAYFATVRETVARHGGVLEKFIGDAAMAVFGVPRARDDDAERAVRAGLALVGAIELLGARLGLAAGDAGLRLRVGVNSGEVVSAESGPDAGRVTGDTVNLAARFQTAAEPGTVLVGELTQLSAADAVAFEPMGSLDLKGKAEPVAAWQVTGLRPERSREEALGSLRAPLLGRAAELDRLETALRAAGEARSAGNVVMVAPPGVGKSRLLAEFARRAEDAGAQVLRARVRADVLGPAEPVGQLLLAALAGGTRDSAPQALGRALAAAGVDPGRAEVVIAEVIDTLWPVGNADPAAAPDRDARFGAWLEALDALAAGRLSVWLVEDIHWAGGDLLAFLAQAGTAVTAAGRLVVATARPSVLEHLAPGTDAFELPPLPALDAAELVRALVGNALPDAVVAGIAERSDGNPLFIEELLRSWISAGTLVAEGDGWRLAVPPEAVPLPATVQAIYAAQLDDLPAAARLVARRASVAGRRFAARALAPLEVPDAAEGLDRLRQRAFLRGPESDFAGDDIYAYRHALLRDAAYASLSRAERGRLHLALAAWLEQTAGTDPSRVAEPIASHYEAALAALPGVGANPDERAHLTDAARTWLERAADAALAVAAPDAAIALLARAIALAEVDSLEDARLRLRRGELLARSGDLALGITEIEAALGNARATFGTGGGYAARTIYGSAVAAFAEAMLEQVRFIEASDLVTAALAELSPPDDPIVGRLLAFRAQARAFQTDLAGTVDEVERAVALVATSGNPRLELEVRHRQAVVRDASDLPIAGEWAEIERLARQLGEWDFATRALRNRAAELAWRVPTQEVIGMVDDANDLAVARGLTEQLAWGRYLLVDLHLGDGEWDAAVDDASRALELAERNAYVRIAFRTWLALSAILAARGDRATLERYRAWWVLNGHLFPQPPSPYGHTNMTGIDIRLRSVGLDPVTDFDVDPATMAEEPYDNPDWLTVVEAVVHHWIGSGQVDRAAEGVRLQREAWSGVRARRLGRLLPASLGLIGAWLARAQGDQVAAAQEGRASLIAARTVKAPWWVARAIRALPAGEATGAELAEAAEIETRLRVRERAAAPPV